MELVNIGSMLEVVRVRVEDENVEIGSQGPQPSSLEDGWVHNTQKTWEFYFRPFHSFHLVTHWEKVIKIGLVSV